MVAGVVLGIGSTVFNVVWQTSLQSLVPPELVGRVSGMGFAIGMSILPLGFLAVGQLIEVLGPVAAFLACGLGLFSCAVLMLTRPEVRGFEMRREEMSG
jgi:MFS family permease